MINISDVLIMGTKKSMMKNKLMGCLLLVFCASSLAAPNVLPMRERAQLINQILDDRLQHLLPGLMRREGIDMWVLISREYNEASSF